MTEMTNALSKTRLFAAVSLAAAMSAAQPALAQSDEDEGPDTSRWQCRNCPFEYGFIGSILFGPIYVTDDYPEFGNYRGLKDEGFYPGIGIDLVWRNEAGRYLDVYGERLGLESRSLFIEGGQAGSYRVRVGYDEIQHYRAGDTRTIFVGAGTADQTLPDNWVLAGTTEGLTQLDASLRPFDIGRERRILNIGFETASDSPWQYRADVQRTRQEGTFIKGASFIFRAAELAAPVDYETTKFDAGIAYVVDQLRLEGSYNLSMFDNGTEALHWENPFLGIFGAQIGQMATAPDNQFHQFMLSGSWRYSRYFTLAGQLGMGRIEQDDDFLPTTVNPNIASPVLPRSNLDGEVDTRVANLRATANFTRSLRGRVQFRYDERDNDSPRDPYVQVVSDTFLTGSVVNEPYSYERRSVDASLDQRFDWITLSGFAKRKEMERTLQEVHETETDTYRVKLRLHPLANFNLSVEGEHSERTNDLDPALLGPEVNPRLRRFHYADREREAVRVTADYALLSNVVAGVYVDIADEDYRDTEIGLSDARTESYGVDLSASIGKHVSVHAFYALERLEADIRGADDNDGAMWRAEQDDDYETLGFGVRFDQLPGKWVRADLNVTYATADGDIRIDKDTVQEAPDFPQLETTRFTLEAIAERAIAENLNLRVGWVVGKLTEDDFFRDNVEPGTIPTVLSLGEGTPDRTVHVLSAMLRYQFN
jgi:MtrB/PioB family decaheme-associated outer membrane protein